MIRAATEADVTELVPMLLAFQTEAGCYRHVKPDAENLKSFINDALQNPEILSIVVYEAAGEIAGTAAIITSQSWFNRDHKEGQELWWYVKPGFRKRASVARRLFEWLETWPRENGVQSMTIGHTGTIEPDRIREFYERRGYVLADVFYNKEVR